MKKCISLMLALLMALAFCTVSWADSGATVGGVSYSTLAEALAHVTKDTPLTEVSEDLWPADKPVYYNGNFYTNGTGFGAKGALELAIEAANTADSSEVANIYVRPDYDKDGSAANIVLQAHQVISTSIAIYGNNAFLNINWEPCVEYPGSSPDSGAHQLTKDISISIYNLHGGAGLWGARVTDHKVDLVMENCNGVYQFMFYGNENGAKGATNITVKNCEFDATSKDDHNVICIIGAGDITVENSTFKAANINLKNVNGGDNTVTIKETQFTDTVAGNQNIRVRGFKEETKIDVTIDNVSFAGASDKNIEIGEESQGTLTYTITNTSGKLNLFDKGSEEAVAKDLQADTKYSNAPAQPEQKPSNNYYYYSPSTDTTSTKGSPKTFDAGIGVYAVTAVLSLTGLACTGKKKF